MKFGPRWGGIAATGAAVVALAACGNPIAHVTTDRAVGNAPGQALAQPGLNLQISLAVPQDHLLQMSRTGGGKGSMTPAMAAGLSRTSLVVNMYAGHGESIQSKQFNADPDNQVELALQVRGDRLVDIRYRGGVMYARANMQALYSDFGQPLAGAKSLQAGLAKGDAFLPGLAALGAGKWVSANLQQLTPLLKLGGLSTSGSGQYQPGSSAWLDHLESALEHDTVYSNLGKQGDRTEYQANVQTRTILDQLSTDLSSLAASIPVPGASGMSSGISQAINQAVTTAPQTVALQMWIKNNRLQEVDLDLNQFTHTYSFAVPLRVLIAPGSSVAAPHATPLQISGIAGLLGGLGNLGGAGGSGGGQAS
jgi:hypothetical protein